MEVAKIDILVTPDGQVKYHSNMPVAMTVFYLEFVKADLIRSSSSEKPQKQIVVPQMIPPPNVGS